MDIQPLPMTPNKTTSVDRGAVALGRESEAVEDAFESELLSWLASDRLEPPATLEAGASREEIADIEKAALDEPLFTAEGELAGTPSLAALGAPFAGGEVNGELLNAKDLRAQTSAAPPAQLTEEQLNLRKLVDYLKELGRESAAKEPVQPRPAAEATTELETRTAVELEVEPEATELEPERPIEGELLEGEPEGEPEGELKLGFSSRSEGGEGQRGFGQHQAQALAEAQIAAAQRPEESQLSQASRKMMAELRERLAHRAHAKLPLNLVLEEAAVPMRLRFQPGAGGAHEVAFVVSTMKARRELRRLMPEIETVLTELPVELADVRIEIEPRLQGPAREKRR